MDKFVSRHKSTIINYLNCFIDAEKNNISMFNGAGSYNFGLIAYGLPGCGKTTLIKVIANMLGRKVMIVNMSKITKTSDFKKLFYETIEKQIDLKT